MKNEPTPIKPDEALVQLPAGLQKKLELHMEQKCKNMSPRQKRRYMEKKFNIVLKAK